MAQSIFDGLTAIYENKVFELATYLMNETNWHDLYSERNVLVKFMNGHHCEYFTRIDFKNFTIEIDCPGEEESNEYHEFNRPEKFLGFLEEYKHYL